MPTNEDDPSRRSLRIWRFHLFEFGDLLWFPQFLREAETSFLNAAYRMLPFGRVWAEKIAGVLPPDEPVQILDLCSGAGGPILGILDELEQRGFQVKALLTDRFPNPSPISDSRISWAKQPVDAARVPLELPGLRTMFSAFHHFRPDSARKVLQSAFDGHRSICIFESGPGTLTGVLTTVLIPINVLVLMPFVRPFRWANLLFTYLIPVLPIVITWDGFVSMLRTYSPAGMDELTKVFKRPDYRWETGRLQLRGIPGGLPYLIGRSLS